MLDLNLHITKIQKYAKVWAPSPCCHAVVEFKFSFVIKVHLNPYKIDSIFTQVSVWLRLHTRGKDVQPFSQERTLPVNQYTPHVIYSPSEQNQYNGKPECYIKPPEESDI